MRILLDECLPKRLKRELAGHDVQTVPEAGWAGKSNGELIRLAARKFDVFITIDRNLVAQQNLARVSFAVIVLMARSNRLDDVKPRANDQLGQHLTSKGKWRHNGLKVGGGMLLH